MFTAEFPAAAPPRLRDEMVHLLVTVVAVALAALALLLFLPRSATAQAPASPLDSIARLAISRNLGVRQSREAEQQSSLAVRQARGLFLPTLGAEARYSEMSGAIDLGDAINPAYAALNQLIGRNQFPTNIHQTVPYKQETKLKSVLPLFNGALVNRALGARDTARVELDAVTVQARARALAARADHLAALRRRAALIDSVLPSAIEVAELSAEAYRAGGLDLTGTLAAEQSLSDVKLAAVRATADSSRALGLLEHAAGRPW